MADAQLSGSPQRRPALIWAGLFLFLSLALWRFTPLREWADPVALQRTLEGVASRPELWIAVLAGMVLLTCLGFPLLVLATAAGATWPAGLALPLCMAGLMISAWIGFEIGRRVPIQGGHRPWGRKVTALRELAERSSTLGMALLRNVPVAPFAWVNMASGALGVPRPAYLWGTWLGTLPPLVLVIFFGAELRGWLESPSSRGLATMALPLGLLVVFAASARWAYARRRSRKSLVERIPGEETR